MAFMNMTLRGIVLSLSLVCFFFQSEVEHPSEGHNVIMVAIFGGYAIISFGLLVDTTLDLNSDRGVVVALLAFGALCFSICVVLSAKEYEVPKTNIYGQRSTYRDINKSLLSSICVVVLLSDIGILLNTKTAI